MKKKLVLAGLIGFVVGVAVASLLIVSLVRNQRKFDAWRDSAEITDSVTAAWMIRRGEQQEVVKRTDANLSKWVLQQRRHFTKYPSTINALWIIERYSKQYKIAFPAEVQTVISSFPSPPPTSCEKRERDAKAAGAVKEAPAETASAP